MDGRVINGDCRDVVPQIAAASIDCIITDPPYGETSLEWDSWPVGWLDGLARVLKPHGSMWLFGSQRMFLERAAEFAGWKFAQDVVWEKHNGTNMFNDRFRRVHEHALQFYPSGTAWKAVYKRPLYTADAVARTVRRKQRPAQWGDIGAGAFASQDGGPRLMRSVMFCRSEHGRAIHPTQKPVECVAPLIEYSCPPDGTVLDLFAGSGTVGVACARAGRTAMLIEANPDHWRAARERLSRELPLEAA